MGVSKYCVSKLTSTETNAIYRMRNDRQIVAHSMDPQKVVAHSVDHKVVAYSVDPQKVVAHSVYPQKAQRNLPIYKMRNNRWIAAHSMDP